jgi:hypothetical protein
MKAPPLKQVGGEFNRVVTATHGDGSPPPFGPAPRRGERMSSAQRKRSGVAAAPSYAHRLDQTAQAAPNAPISTLKPGPIVEDKLIFLM